MPTISTLTVDVESRTSSFSRGLKVAVGGLAALAAGAAFAFSKFEESENVLQQTEAVLKSTGGAANVTAKQVQGLADALSRKSSVDDEVIQSGLNMLLTFKNIRNEVGANNDIFNQASVAVTDMAAGMAAASGGEIDMKAASIQLGKALNDPVAGMTALTRVGVQFTEEQQKQIAQLVKHNNLLGAQKIILGEVTSQFAGSAKANATASGTMRVAFENLAETVGQVLAPAINALLQGLTKAVEFLMANVGPAFQAAKDWVLGVWEQIQPLAEGIGSVLIPALKTMWEAITKNLIPGLKKLWDAFGPLLKVLGLAALAFGVVMVAQIALFVTAVSKLIGWLGDLVEAFMKVVSWVRENFAEPIVGALQKVGEWLATAAGWVKDRLLGAWQAIKGPVLAVIHAFIQAIQTLIGWIKSAIGFITQLGQGVSQALAEAGRAQGVFNGINPPRPGISPNIQGGGGNTININGAILGGVDQVVDQIHEGLLRKKKRNGLRLGLS